MNGQAFIWDLDGTLLDPYKVIVESLYLVYKEKGFEVDRKEILSKVIWGTVTTFTNYMEEKHGLKFDEIKERYYEISAEKMPTIEAMESALETVKELNRAGARNFVFTHRDYSSSLSILKRVGFYPYFEEIVSSRNGFKRKPDPEALNYLVDKYNLDKDNTYYVGDRAIDIECANASGVKSIMFLPPFSVAKATGEETFVVDDLLKIVRLLKN